MVCFNLLSRLTPDQLSCYLLCFQTSMGFVLLMSRTAEHLSIMSIRLLVDGSESKYRCENCFIVIGKRKKEKKKSNTRVSPIMELYVMVGCVCSHKGINCQPQSPLWPHSPAAFDLLCHCLPTFLLQN